MKKSFFKSISISIILLIISVSNIYAIIPNETKIVIADSTIRHNALIAVNKVIDKVIASTNFNLVQQVQKPSETVQSVYFPKNVSSSKKQILFAQSTLDVLMDGIYTFGFSSGTVCKVSINNQIAFRLEKPDDEFFSEFAYDRYKFPHSFSVYLKKGTNKMVIKLESNENPKFQIAAILFDGQINGDIKFQSVLNSATETCSWLVSYNDSSTNQETEFSENSQPTNWFSPTIPLVSKLVTNSDSPFKKHSYVEWHYSNGVTLWSILNYATQTKNLRYGNFVSDCCKFNLQHEKYFRNQYFELNEIHGYNHRLYRMSMLDDASAPALPYLMLYTKGKLDSAKKVLTRVENFVQQKQKRLADGTFCRPEPWQQTVWADDLFMIAPCLMLLGESTGNSTYYDEAAFQVISFYRYLFSAKNGLCKHGWVNSQQADSIPYWARANGWMIWATSEVLLKLPKTHKDYKAIQKIFRKHIDGLISFQNKEGFLHQVIDHPDSFTETSSTAMLTIALARAVNYGWLPKRYSEPALKSWNAVLTRIEPDGTVKGICEGTSINTGLEYYLNRKTMDHDPRGLGAVITAGLEISKLTDCL